MRSTGIVPRWRGPGGGFLPPNAGHKGSALQTLLKGQNIICKTPIRTSCKKQNPCLPNRQAKHTFVSQLSPGEIIKTKKALLQKDIYSKRTKKVILARALTRSNPSVTVIPNKAGNPMGSLCFAWACNDQHMSMYFMCLLSLKYLRQ